MAGKKGRSGRKKKITRQQLSKSSANVAKPNGHDLAEAAKMEILESAAKAGDGLADKVKSMFTSPRIVEVPEVSGSAQSGMLSAESSMGSVTSFPESGKSNFDATAAELAGKYGGDPGSGGLPAGSPNAEVPTAALPPVALVPEKPPEIFPPETVRTYLGIAFEGLERKHGSQWHLSQETMSAYSQATSDMLSEQAPRWLAESQNKYLVIWVMLTLGIIATRSEKIAKGLEWLTDKVLGNFGAAGTPKPEDSTKQESQASSASWAFQAQEKPH